MAAVISMVLVSIVWFQSVRIGAYLSMPDAYSDPEFYNLTRHRIMWDVYYGVSPLCGDLPCHITSDYPSSKFSKQMILPTHEMPLVGYQKGQLIYYRAKIELPERLIAQGDPLVFHSRYIFARNFRYYINEVLVDEGQSDSINLNIPRSLIPADRQIVISFAIDPGNNIYQGLANTYELLIGAKERLKDLAFFNREINTTYYLWFLLPKITFCLIFSLVFLFVSRTRSLFMFVLYAYTAAFDAFVLSGYAPMMLPIGPHGKFYWALARATGVIFLFGFIYEVSKMYLGDRKNLRHLDLRVLTLVLAGLSLLAYLARQFAFEATVIKVLQMTHALLYPLIFIFGFWMLRDVPPKLRNIFLRWFFAFSAFVGVVWLVRTTADVLSIKWSFGFAWSWINDLVLFVVLTAVAIMDVGESLAAKVIVEKELNEVNQRLELAETVQRMLLPKNLAGTIFGPLRYKFIYEPAQTMSGDWLAMWTGEEQVCLFLGDVVGKGPQAALAVSIVSSIIAESKHEGLDIEQCMVRINRQLLHLFGQHINTTMASIAINKGGRVDLYNAGAIGFFTWDGQKIQHLPLRSTSLGVLGEPKFAKTSLDYVEGMRIFTFTDGVLEGSRAIKQLANALKKQEPGPAIDFDQLGKVIIEVGREHVLDDDKTVLMVGPGAAA